MPPSPNWCHCSVVGCLAKTWNCFLEYFTFHIQIGQNIWDSNEQRIDWRTSTKLLSEVRRKNSQQIKISLSLIVASLELFPVSAFLFPPEKRFLKSFTTNILSQFWSLQGVTAVKGGRGKGTITTTFNPLNLA